MKTDTQLRNDVRAELSWDPAIPAAGVGVTVRDGVVTLSGHLDTYAQKYAAERAAHPDGVAQKIREALSRQAHWRARRIIGIRAEDLEARRHGSVPSWAECEAVQGAAWAAPGVSRVVSQLQVEG